MEEQRLTEQDALLAIEIFTKALGYRSQIGKSIIGEEYLALSPEERLNEMLTPRITFHIDGNVPCLFFRFVGDESPVIEAFFYPIEAVYAFLAEARSYFKWLNLSDRTDEELEVMAIDRATEMALIMIDNFYPRAEMMMDSFISEVIAQWRFQNRQNIIHYHAERGNPLPRQKAVLLDLIIKDYAKKIGQLWKYQGQTSENWHKLSLAEEYGAIYKHWKRLSRMSSDDEDWREYAKAGKFQDTPDDLLDKLENTDRLDVKIVEHKVSELAVEHAARRVRLIKKHGVSESVIKQRKEGVRVTGYSSAQLFEFLKQGRELIANWKATQETLAQEKAPDLLEQNGETAQATKVKSLEQKIKFIESKSDKSVEQNGDSAQEEKG